MLSIKRKNITNFEKEVVIIQKLDPQTNEYLNYSFFSFCF